MANIRDQVSPETVVTKGCELSQIASFILSLPVNPLASKKIA